MYHADLFCKGILLKYLINHVTLSTTAGSNRCLLHLWFVWKNVSYMENFLMGIVVEHSWDIRRPCRKLGGKLTLIYRSSRKTEIKERDHFRGRFKRRQKGSPKVCTREGGVGRVGNSKFKWCLTTSTPWPTLPRELKVTYLRNSCTKGGRITIVDLFFLGGGRMDATLVNVAADVKDLTLGPKKKDNRAYGSW